VTVASFAALAWAGVANAQLADKQAAEMTMDTVVVSPTRSEQSIAQTAPAITVITGADLERKQVTTVVDALREVPGLQVNENGSRGSTTSVLLRGANSDQVLVLVDGVRVNSTTLGSFDFAGLTPENVDRIEVMRGFGGTLYGSEAIGGVIQIFTRKGSGPPRGSVSVSGGNANTDREVGEISGQSGIFSYSGSASHIHTDGWKPVNDDYENTAVSARVDAQVIPEGTARVSFRLTDSEFGNFSSNNFLAAPDPDARQQDQTTFTRAEWNHAVLPELRYRLAFSYARQDQQFDDLADAAETSTLHSDFLSETFAGDSMATLDWLGGLVQSTAGVEYEVQRGDADSLFSDPAFGDSPTRFERDVRNIAGYTLHQLFLDERRLVISGGVRVDDNQRFGQAVSPSGGVTYLLAATGTRLRATYGKGFHAPTLNQLFFPFFGNPDLDAERSWEVNVGVDQTLLADRALVTTNFFHRRVRDLIAGVPGADGLFLAQNVGSAKIDGAEASLDVEVVSGVRVGGEYAFLNLDTDASGRVRRPKHSGSVHCGAERSDVLQDGDRISADVRLLLVGDRLDFEPTGQFGAVTNRAYQRADLAAAYSWSLPSEWVKRAKVFARVENLFDKHYQEVLGFGARPTNFMAGIGGEF
jgi:vitamin B12 transporter